MDRSPARDWVCIFCHHGTLFYQPNLEERDKHIYHCKDCLSAYPFQRHPEPTTNCSAAHQHMSDPRGIGHMELIVGPISEHNLRGILKLRSTDPDAPTARHQDTRIIRGDLLYPGRTRTPEGDATYAPAVMHAACLQLARERLPYFNARFIDRFARYTMTVLPRFLINSVAKTARGQLTPPFPTTKMNQTELVALLRRAAKLPPEIQAHICEFLPPCFVTSLLNTHKTLEWLETRQEAIDQFTYNDRGEITLLRYSAAPFTFLGAKSIVISGETCLTNIGTDPSGDYDHLISIDEQAAKGDLLGIEYMLGTYGVCAMRLKYRDRSVSSWLGDEFGWITFSPLANLRDLAWAEDVR
jgi:hypothetical protein